MSKKETKTNAMRILEKLKIEFGSSAYECDEFIDGKQTADTLGLPYDMVYKTIVCMGKSKEYYVFVIPIEDELDLKKGAKIVSEKTLEMLPLKDLTKVTGYVRGGCTAIGMKKQYKTIIDEQALFMDKIAVSGGRVGLQLTLNPEDYAKAVNASFGDIVKN